MATFKETNIHAFIEHIIEYDFVDEIIDECKNQSIKGFVFERLFDVFINFGFCDVFNKNNYEHLSGNVNNGKLKATQLESYLNENVISGNSSGCSDITLKNKTNNEYVFISSKYPKTTELIEKTKSIDYYDVQNIIAMVDENKHVYKKYDVYLLVPDKKILLKKVKQSNKSSRYIAKYMTEENILDKNDLQKYFLKFKNDISQNMDSKLWHQLYFTSKEKLQLRFHQELITQKTCELIEEGNKLFLWGCKCRSGKTFMTGSLINKQKQIKNKLNVLIITPAPTETTPQFTDDLFHKFKDFDDFKIHNIKGSKSINTIKLEDNNIFVMSKQLLQKYTNDETIKIIKNAKLDIICFDENHFTGTTDLSKQILDSYSSKNTIKVFLTATYNKPLHEWNIEPECQMYWDIEDEQICKSILKDNENLDKLKDKHGYEYISNTINKYVKNGESINEIFKSYENMPNLHLITNMFDSQRYETIKEQLKLSENKMGFCFDTLFGLNKNKTKFSFENEVQTILRYISGSHKEQDGYKMIFNRIDKICSELETRKPFTQIWFLPSNNINEISKCLEELMENDLILKKYDVLCVNRKNNNLAKDVKDEITKKETEAKSKGKLGLIILAGNMLSLGITLNSCDLVILMNNTLSSDKVLQQMYRCMTEGPNKKIGFVVDLNISRVLNTCINYSVHKKEKCVDDKIKYLIENHLINIDVDMMMNKKINSDKIIKKLMEIWKNDPINSFQTLLKNLDNDFIEFDNPTQKLLNNMFTKSCKNKIKMDVILKDENDEIQELPSGKTKEKIDEDSNDEQNNDSGDEIEKEENNISFTKDVLPHIIPLICILTSKNQNMDFIQMLNDINENPELLETFNDQCLIWWNKKDLIELIKNIVSKYFNKNSNPYNISVQFKMSIKSLIDKPKELLELINECLKPKNIEKKQYGEVFTPMPLVNEMLDKLPEDVWTNKNLKWLDLCCGMGNFPIAVYLRLMDGLSEVIKDTKKRKKHILENMLYMCELNKKNVLICKQIFDINDEYKLNIHEGDSLKLNCMTQFNVNDFDVIIGNPPYNASGTKSSGNTIWQFFVTKSLEILKQKGHLCFVHPNGWRKPNTERGKFYRLFKKMTSENTMKYLEIHDTKDGQKQFNCGTRYDWYIIQKEKNKQHKTIIIDQNKIKYELNLMNYNWLANCELKLIDMLIANENEPKCEILQSMSAYEPRKKWISKTKTEEFKYPVVHSTPKDGPRFVWSNKIDNGFFGVAKVIFGDGGINIPIIDMEGEYGMTQHAMAITINDKKEGEMLSKCLCSTLFNKIIKACLWSSFAIEWGMFKDLKKNFYEILNEQNNDELNNEKITVKSKKKTIKKKQDDDSDDEQITVKPKNKTVKKKQDDDSDDEQITVKPKNKTIKKKQNNDPDDEEITVKPKKKTIKKKQNDDSDDEEITVKPKKKTIKKKQNDNC